MYVVNCFFVLLCGNEGSVNKVKVIFVPFYLYTIILYIWLYRQENKNAEIYANLCSCFVQFEL